MSTADPVASSPFRSVKALLFDVFGTVVDWRSTVTGALIRRAHEKTTSPAFKTYPEALQARFHVLKDDDWAQFAQEWRHSYGRFTKSFVPGVTGWKDIDTHHYESLVELLGKWEIVEAFDVNEIRDLSLIWHYLTPWEDSANGLGLLGSRYVTSSLSNGNQSLLQDLNKHGNLGFQKLISSADFKAYKPHPSTYLGAARTLGFQPEECAMVAAHLGDLKAARSNGLKTIYVERNREEEWANHEELITEARNWVDLWVSEDEGGFVEVAKRLDISG
ncbi:HAD-like domain-containing protein [Xylariales sp. PMI_506]|nr:HAD-like domain-containing protein [Xylariales sp. PMI_506]